jgi:putative transposase
MPRRKQPTIPDELLNQLLGGSDPRAALADGGLLDGLKKALAERALNAELDHHLGGGEPDGRANGRNGYGAKTVLTGSGRLDLQIPRDRLATFDPQLIAKYQRRFPGFDAKIVSMYARGMSTREIQGHLRELYGIEVSPDLVSAVTDAVLDEVAEWQNRPLEALYPLVFLDALRVKVRDEGTVRNKAVYVALGVRADGTKEVLGLWIEQTEGAKFWLRVMNELRDRGVADILTDIPRMAADFVGLERRVAIARRFRQRPRRSGRCRDRCRGGMTARAVGVRPRSPSLGRTSPADIPARRPRR